MRKAFIREEAERVLCAVYDGDSLSRFFVFPKEVYTGSIVVGKVKFVKKEVGVFVDVGLKRDGILSFRPGLKSGDSVLCRIETEPKEDRGVSISEKITIAGKYAVLIDREEYAFSHEITQEKKAELFSLPQRKGVGFIFRSLAEEGSKEEILSETEELYSKFTEIKEKAKTTSAPAFLYKESAVGLAKATAKYVYDFTAETERDVEKLSDRKVEKDGVELVFDKTEAMTVVDVNFHKSENRGERAIFDADVIAVKEFARQVRLRNIGGVIVLDYISLVRREEREALWNILQDELKKDYVRCNAEHAERSGLFILTRTERHST